MVLEPTLPRTRGGQGCPFTPPQLQPASNLDFYFKQTTSHQTTTRTHHVGKKYTDIQRTSREESNQNANMASASNEQDLLPDQTEGFKVGEKKTMDEYNKLGAWFPALPHVHLRLLHFFFTAVALHLLALTSVRWF